MFSRTPARLPWWSFVSERKVRQNMMMGGARTPVAEHSLHRFYFKKFRKGAFPNRTRTHQNIAMTSVARQRPRRMPWPYDITSLIFNKPHEGSDKIGYVVGTKMIKTAVVACNHLVYYPKYNVRVARSSRYFAHDEDMSCVDGDLVHIKACRKISRYKHYYIFSLLEPNMEGRERLKLGLPSVPPPLFGHPVARRIVKLNLTKAASTKQKTASVLQEHVQEFYRYAGRVGDAKINRAGDTGETNFDDVNALVAPNAPPSIGTGGDDGTEGDVPLVADEGAKHKLSSAEFAGEPDAEHSRDGKKFWMGQQPKENYDYTNFTKSP